MYTSISENHHYLDSGISVTKAVVFMMFFAEFYTFKKIYYKIEQQMYMYGKGNFNKNNKYEF